MAIRIHPGHQRALGRHQAGGLGPQGGRRLLHYLAVVDEALVRLHGGGGQAGQVLALDAQNLRGVRGGFRVLGFCYDTAGVMASCGKKIPPCACCSIEYIKSLTGI